MVLCALGGAACYPVSAAQRSFVIGTAPAWVDSAAPEADDTGFSRTTSSGAICLLNDHQIRVTGAGVERYYRRVNKVLSAAGLDDVSQIELEFEPSYQKLVIHHITIRRGDAVINGLKPGEIKVVQKEEELAQRLYNGTLSAVVFLNDVRAGDVIDYAYSVNGDNPVLSGLYADSYTMVGRLATQKIRWRLLWPTSRKLLYRNRNSDVPSVLKESGEQTEYIWEQHNVLEQEFEEGTPSWFNSVPFVQVSEFTDWSAVVRWALPLYRVQRPLAPGLVSQIERWRKESQDPEPRFLKAVRFVQDEVRYTGIELGQYSHTPTQPSAVFLRRFGDCKDKSLLLCTALNELGIEAHPALVDTEARRMIAEDQPSPHAFNHVIVRAAVAGKVYWLDTTIQLQRGTLALRASPEYGRALVIREGNLDLEDIQHSEVERPATEVKEIYTASSYQGPASLEVTTTYRGAGADAKRYQLSQQSLSELGKTYLNYYAQLDPSIEPAGAIEIKDDEESNAILQTERYSIRDFWRDRRREFYAGQISGQLGRVPAANRKSPLGLSAGYLTVTIEARLPEHFSISGGSGTIATDCLNFRYSFVSAGNTVNLAYQLRTLTDNVPVESLARHSDAVARIQKLLGYEMTRDAASTVAETGSVVSFVPLLLVIGPFAVFGVIKLIQSRRQRVRQTDYKRSLRMSRGETPELAIPVNSAREFGAHVVAFRCACGAAYRLPDDSTQPDSLMFDGRRILVVSLNCERCARTKDTYFAVSGATADH